MPAPGSWNFEQDPRRAHQPEAEYVPDAATRSRRRRTRRLAPTLFVLLAIVVALLAAHRHGVERAAPLRHATPARIVHCHGSIAGRPRPGAHYARCPDRSSAP